jgi:hypothetical protein
MVCDPASNPARRADVVAQDEGHRVGGEQRREALQDREHDLRDTIAFQAAEELRPDAVADGKQEHQEEHRFHIR